MSKTTLLLIGSVAASLGALAPSSPSLDARVPVRGAELAVTLLAPADGVGVRGAAVILLPGSGPSTRSEMAPLAEPFRRAGFTVLTFDKRGCGASGGSWLTSSLDDMAADGRALLDWLKGRGEIDAARIGLLGVSQGGWVGPLVASGRNDVPFLPEPSLRSLRLPVLALIGGRDRDPALEVKAFQSALAENPDPRTEIRVVPGAGHALTLGDDHRRANFNLEALDAAAAWAARVARGKD